MFRCTTFVLLIISTNTYCVDGRYISPFRTSGLCQDNDVAQQNAIEKYEHLFNNFNSTLNVQFHGPPNVDKREYDYIRGLCRNNNLAFKNILDFKFYSDSVENSNAHLSTCPWVMVDNYDEDRIPQVIPEAECVCSRCLEGTKKSAEEIQYAPTFGRCRQIMTSQMTLRRRCNINTGTYEYTPSVEIFSIGCTCTSPVKL